MKYSIALFIVLANFASMPAQSAKSTGYWYDSAGDIVRTGFGECWRTIHWTESNAIPECDNGTPKKVTAEKDSDNDSVPDSKDQCPSTAAGISVDSKGCAKDSDMDGIADATDECPRTQAGIKVDARGCDLDSDKDGIADSNDECPDTERGTVVNKQGCELQQSISLDNVQFKTGTAILSAESRSILDKVADTLNNNEHLNFEVAGHTDNTGNYQYNVSLSESRAQSVRDYLIARGVATERLTSKGYGPDKPVATNDTREGRRQNRRVELMLK